MRRFRPPPTPIPIFRARDEIARRAIRDLEPAAKLSSQARAFRPRRPADDAKLEGFVSRAPRRPAIVAFRNGRRPSVQTTTENARSAHAVAARATTVSSTARRGGAWRASIPPRAARRTARRRRTDCAAAGSPRRRRAACAGFEIAAAGEIGGPGGTVERDDDEFSAPGARRERQCGRMFSRERRRGDEFHDMRRHQFRRAAGQDRQIGRDRRDKASSLSSRMSSRRHSRAVLCAGADQIKTPAAAGATRLALGAAGAPLATSPRRGGRARATPPRAFRALARRRPSPRVAASWMRPSSASAARAVLSINMARIRFSCACARTRRKRATVRSRGQLLDFGPRAVRLDKARPGCWAAINAGAPRRQVAAEQTASLTSICARAGTMQPQSRSRARPRRSRNPDAQAVDGGEKSFTGAVGWRSAPPMFERRLRSRPRPRRRRDRAECKSPRYSGRDRG